MGDLFSEDGTKVVVLTSKSVFLNAQCLFVEYTDIIRCPSFILLMLLASSSYKKESLQRPLDVSPILGMNSEELIKWYCNRGHQNPLLQLMEEGSFGQISIDSLNSFLDANLQTEEFLIGLSPLLNFGTALQLLAKDDKNLVKEIRIYYPYDNPFIKKDVKNILNFDKEDNPNAIDVHFVCGDIITALKDVPNDSTYVFSDISNILLLEEIGKLDYSSILFPMEFAYNYNDEKELIINIEEMKKHHVFKINQFLAIT